MKSTISSRGQVTVPPEVRERLGLLPGTIVLFEIRDDGVLLRKGSPGEHPVDRVFGTLKLSRPVDSSVLLDVLGADPRFGDRSRRAVRAAHARFQADALLTRDRGFYRRYFSGLRLIEVA